MKRLSLKLTLGLGVGIVLASGLFTAVAAQVSPTSATGEYQTNEKDSLGSSFGGSFNPLDLIHNSNLRRSRGAAEFNEDTQDSLNQAAEEFKRLQQQKIQQQQSPTTSETPTVN